jgi:hypothetical protein
MMAFWFSIPAFALVTYENNDFFISPLSRPISVNPVMNAAKIESGFHLEF